MENDDNLIELVEMVFKISRQMKAQMSYTHHLTHLSVSQIQTLFFLNQSEREFSMSDIANYLRIELPSATSMINKLCSQNLVKRYEDNNDRRLVRIALTSAGKKMLDQIISERRKKLENVLSYLSAKEKSDLLSILKTLNIGLQK